MNSDDAEVLLVELGVGYHDNTSVFHFGIALDDSLEGQANKLDLEADCCADDWHPLVLHVSDGRTYVSTPNGGFRLDESGLSHPFGTVDCTDDQTIPHNCLFIKTGELEQWMEDPFHD